MKKKVKKGLLVHVQQMVEAAKKDSLHKKQSFLMVYTVDFSRMVEAYSTLSQVAIRPKKFVKVIKKLFKKGGADCKFEKGKESKDYLEGKFRFRIIREVKEQDIRDVIAKAKSDNNKKEAK